MKNGIIKEDDKLVFYKDDIPFHAGVIEIDGGIYYVGRHGKVATGQHIVHKEMSNGILEHGTYTFDDNGKLIEGSFIPAKRIKSSSHSSSKKKSSSRGKKRRSRFRLSKKKKIRITCAVVSAILLIAVAFLIDSINSHYKDTPVSQGESVVYLPSFDEPVALCTMAGQKLYNNEITMKSLKEVDVYLPFEFQYTLGDRDGMFTLSENADLTNSRQFILAKNESPLEIHNLKTGTTYYYQVKVGEETYAGSFETAQGTRFIYIPGVYNTRDIGGYTTADGKKIKQGMIIRGTEMDGLVEPSYFLSSRDVQSVQEQFGFVFDMDLRYSAEVAEGNGSPLGKDVRYKNYGAPMYLSVFNKSNYASVKNIFSDLAKEENYPMYFHCTYGADRTGTFIYLLQGLLGVSEQDMVKEFQMTGMFSRDYADSTRMDAMAEKIEDFPGETTAEKIEYFLTKEVGVSKAEIESMRNILLED